MHAERDALRDYVLPHVNEFAARYGRQVELIDLRWGIDTEGIGEGAQSRKVLQTCLEEIARSRPFFIGILGDRYGWVVPQDILESTLSHLGSALGGAEKAVTELEIEYGALSAEDDPLCLFYFRNLDRDNLPEAFRDDPAGAARLEGLKGRIRAQFGARVKEYTPRLEGDTVAELEDFCTMLVADIIFALEQQWGPAPDGQKSRYALEAEAQAAFYTYHMEAFAGRDGYLARLSAACLADGGPPILALTGETGSGKSALLSALGTQLAREGCLALPFYCGNTGRSATLEDMLLYFINALCPVLGLNEESGSGLDLAARRDLLASLLREAAPKGPIILLVDSPDALRPSRLLEESLLLDGLLPPGGVRVVLTCAPGHAALASLGRLGAEIEPIEALSAEDIAAVLQGQARAQHRELTPAVIRHIGQRLDSEGRLAAGNPLYLRLLMQVFGQMSRQDHAKIEGYTAQGMAPMNAIASLMIEQADAMGPRPEAVYDALITRAEAIIGRDFVQTALALIAASRFGLREDALGEAFAQLGLPYATADFAWLRQLLGRQFVQGEHGQWRFVHRLLRRAVLARLPHLTQTVNAALIPVLRRRLALERHAADEILYCLHRAGRPDIAAEIVCGDISYYTDNGLPDSAYAILASRPKAVRLSLMGYSAPLVGIITAEENVPHYGAALADLFMGDGRDFVLAIPRRAAGLDGRYAALCANLYYDALMAVLPAETDAEQRMTLVTATLECLEDRLDGNPLNARLYGELCALAADLCGRMGREAEAERYLDDNLRTVNVLYRESGDREDEWLVTLSLHRLGDFHMARGALEAALDCYQQALARRRTIAEIDPAHDVSASYLRVGTALAALGRAEAEDVLLEALTLSKARVQRQGDGESLQTLAVAASRLSAYYEANDQRQAAFDHAALAHETLRHAYAQEGQLSYLEGSAAALLDMARTLGANAPEDAAEYGRMAVEAYDYLHQRRRSSASAQAVAAAALWCPSGKGHTHMPA